MKKTEWFPADVMPTRAGLYEVYRPIFECEGATIPPSHMLRWTGLRWVYAYHIGLSDDGDFADMSGDDRWRGLQGDEHSIEIGAGMYLVEFSEGPDRPEIDE